MAPCRINRVVRALTHVVKSESDPAWRKSACARGRIEPVRPRREGVGRALSSVFGSAGEVIPIDLELLLAQLDEAAP
jgi:hypothetical protein